MVRLDIGCGDQLQDGWVGIDPHYKGANILPHDAWGLPYKDSCVGEIRCVHALEHIPADRLPEVFWEWHRVLRLGGEVFVSVPSARWVLQHILDKQRVRSGDRLVFGSLRWPGDRHVTAFDPGKLVALLTGAGFGISSQGCVWSEMHHQESIEIHAYKL
jgi:predicted SAM-dependent methyltransferase